MKRKINININDVMGQEQKFESLLSFIKFLEREISAWSNLTHEISYTHPYFTQRNQFQNALNTVNGWKNQIDTWGDTLLQQQITHLQRNYLNSFRSYWLWSGHSFIPTWINSYKISKESGDAFIEAIKDKSANNTQSFNAMKGYILAYEFELQDESSLTQRRNSEKKSIYQLRNQLNNKTNELIQEVDDLEDDFNNWQTEIKKGTNKLQSVHKKLFSRAQKQKEKNFNTFMDKSEQNIEDLEKTYQEKLRLEKPAIYWNKKADIYKKQGLFWSAILFVVLVFGIGLFGYYFLEWTKGASLALKFNSLQGAVIFMTMITIYAILIKSISKMVFSSFHLQRDSEEREQLTYVYLSLTNEDGAIDEDSRKIVLQALFSRADSGLLHKDSSPTMPGLNELIKASGGR